MKGKPKTETGIFVKKNNKFPFFFIQLKISSDRLFEFKDVFTYFIYNIKFELFSMKRIKELFLFFISLEIKNVV